MIIVFVLSVITLAIVILAVDYKTEWSRYLSGIFLLGALSGLNDEIPNSFIPFIKKNFIVADSSIDFLFTLHGFLTMFCEHIGIFLVAMYCVSYSGLLKKSVKMAVTFALFFIAVISLFSNPWLMTDDLIAAGLYKKYYFETSVWGVPALISGLIMLYTAYFKEKNPGLIRQRFVNLLLATPVIISGMLNLLALRAMGLNHNLAKINLFIILAIIIVFIVFAVRNGAFGIRIRIDRQSIIGSIDTISEGTAIFNHTLKNEVGKVSIATTNLKTMGSQEHIDIGRYNDNIEVLENSVSNLSTVIKRIQHFSKIIKLTDSVFDIKEILDKSVANISVFLIEKNISMEKKYFFNIKILCDESHLVEAITNILKNSCEALSSGGRIKIELYGNKNVLYISISDNGPGIKKEYASKVFEPFFTTKESSKNFGFGLSYAYKVLNMHKGDLSFYSKEKVGTSVVLSIPKFRIRSYDNNLPQRSK